MSANETIKEYPPPIAYVTFHNKISTTHTCNYYELTTYFEVSGPLPTTCIQAFPINLKFIAHVVTEIALYRGLPMLERPGDMSKSTPGLPVLKVCNEILPYVLHAEVHILTFY